VQFLLVSSGANWFPEKRSEVRWTILSVFVTFVDSRVSVELLAEDLRPSSGGTLNSCVANRTTTFPIQLDSLRSSATVHSGIVNNL
jgi:hypothetical protein